ncbi:MAG TPA: DNA adenine methylase [Burkholderiaceae bacterium]|nr:DNA adenine methylase [Burkholderiaceae bacterium]
MSTNTRSILRYPGSKARFCEFIAKTIAMNSAKPRLLVEPFCGGASVSIALLERGHVDEVAINDVDPLIGMLWSVVFSKDDAAWLANQVQTVPLTLDEWRRQKALNPANAREAALKCLFLNRTSFNGIIHKAGPLGGWGQTGIKIDVRFNREKLATRILELSKLEGAVTVRNENWRAFCYRYSRNPTAVFYLDPPYYHKAEQLYGHVFDEAAHEELRDYLHGFARPWLLSYDDAQEVRDLYEGMAVNARVIDNSYSTHPLGGCSFIGRELIFTNMKKLPAAYKAHSAHVGLSVKPQRKSRAGDAAALRFPISAAASAAGQA